MIVSMILLTFMIASPFAALLLGLASVALLALRSRRFRLLRILSLTGLACGVAGTVLLLWFSWYNHELHRSGQETDYVFSTRAMAREALVGALLASGGATMSGFALWRSRERSSADPWQRVRCFGGVLEARPVDSPLRRGGASVACP